MILGVCVSRLCRAEKAEQIQVLFGVHTMGYSIPTLLDGVPDLIITEMDEALMLPLVNKFLLQFLLAHFCLNLFDALKMNV